MAWEEDLFALFDDLEGRAEALYEAERIVDHADRSRAEYAGVTLASRVMASVDRSVRAHVLGVGAVAGEIRRVAADWLLLHGNGQDWVIRLDAVSALAGVSERSVPEVAWSPLTRLGFAAALRRIAEADQPCVAHLRDGARHDVRLRRVGADFVEAVEGLDTVVLLGFAAIAAVQSRPDP